MQKWIIGALLGLIMQGSAMVGAAEGSQLNGSMDVAPVRGGQTLEKKGTEFPVRAHHHYNCDRPGPAGPAGDPGPQGEGYQRFASYWLTNQPSLVAGQNVLFNLQQTLEGIQYDQTTGTFTLPPGVYVINFFATPVEPEVINLNLNVNGASIPCPSLQGATIVVNLSADSNQVSVQATGDWSPVVDGSVIGTYFFAYASIVIYQIGS